jgi:hypothetical protein
MPELVEVLVEGRGAPALRDWGREEEAIAWDEVEAPL